MAKLTKREKKKLNGIAKKHWKPLLVIAIILIILVAVAYYMGWIDLLINKFKKPVEPETEQTGGNVQSSTPVLSTAGGYSTNVTTLNDLEITFIDVGQGDCILIELPDNKKMIIDSGVDTDSKNAIEETLTSKNITTFDYVLLTHQDADHAANMDWILENYTCKFIFRPNNNSTHTSASSLPADFNTGFEDPDRNPTKTYADFMNKAYAELQSGECATVEIFNKDSDFANDVIYNGTTYTYSFNFLTPTASRNEIQYDDYNDYSPIMLLEWQGKKVLFTGDAEKENIEEYVETYGSQYNVDILKMGHHGSRTSTTPALLSAIDPEYAVIQCGIGNSYEHPHPEPLQYLKNHDTNMKLYRNDIHGDIILTIDSLGNIEFTQETINVEHTWVDGNTLAGLPQYQELNFNLFNIWSAFVDTSKKVVA